MDHKTVIVEVIELSDEQVKYHIRCCDDPDTDEHHTMSVYTNTTGPQNHDDALAAVMKKVADKHEAKLQWRQKMQQQGVKVSKK